MRPLASTVVNSVLAPGPTVLVGDALGEYDFGTANNVAMFVDEVLLDSAITKLVVERMSAVGAVTLNSVADRSDDIDAITQIQAALAGAEVVVAVGGGRVLDVVKLSLATASNQAAFSLLTQRRRGGLVPFGFDKQATAPLFVAIPTTFGTGSEVSPVAVLSSAGRRRLVHGLVLSPDVAVLHELATESLPGWLALEGACEILTRLLGVYIGETYFDRVVDGVVESMVVAAVKLGHLVKQANDADRSLDAHIRLHLASLSSLSHMSALNLGRTPYSHRGWYVANELSYAAGVRKTTALSAVMPAMWRQLLDGEDRWGSAARLGVVWGVIRSSTPHLDGDPATGLSQLLASWELGAPVALSTCEIESVALQCVRGWGGTLPMLNGLGVREVIGVLELATTEPQAK